MNKTLEEVVKAASVNGRLPCAVAFKIAKEVKVGRRQVGDMANQLKIRVIDCQLGCFQLAKSSHDDLDTIDIKSVLAGELETFLVNGYLPCAVAFKVARKLRITPKEVGDVATKKKVRIVNCQLGCFQ